ncbi:MAG: hypothetical protein K8S13_18895 [Desulfobacula sp.]|uniref:hypothetical protein n=1 Tax=Desulfobacula sp. TaxID=2593537 RepID=UPI0025B8F3AC|nr:hypothetical protein [Desulfobacula sp.]MCD4721904.1 hypothetical protein [Desulfobacula sp.]
MERNIMMLLGILTLCSLYTCTAISFLKSRIPKKRREYERTRRLLGITESTPEKEDEIISAIFHDEFNGKDYLLPVLFVTIFSALGFWVLFSDQPPIILTGIFHCSDKSVAALTNYVNMSLVSIAMAFLGSYIWSIQYIVRRLINLDLIPSAFYSIGTRMILSTFISVVLHHLIQSSDGKFQKELLDILPVLAFLTGIFPQKILKYIQEKSLFMLKKESRANPLPLEMIEGMNLFHRVRLAEVGIDNAQNLANSNMRELIVRTPFNPLLLFDWLSQSKLYIYVKDNIECLRKSSIRTNFDLIAAQERDELNTVSKVSGIDLEELKTLCGSVKVDLENSFLEKIRENLISL